MNPNATSDAACVSPLTAPGTRVDVHRECLGCGYDIWNQDAVGVCSECGREIRLTLAVPVWAWEEPERAWRLARALRTMAVGVLAALGLCIVTALCLIFAAIGRREETIAVIGCLAVMGALAVHVAGLLRAAMAAPGAAWVGFGSAASLVSVGVLMLGVIAHESRMISMPAVNSDNYGYTVGAFAVAQGVLLGLWLALNHTTVSSRRRGEWMLWCGLAGAVLFGGLGLFLMAGASGWFDYRRGQTLMIVFGLSGWGITLGILAWTIWAPIQWLRAANRLDVLRMSAMQRPQMATPRIGLP